MFDDLSREVADWSGKDMEQFMTSLMRSNPNFTMKQFFNAQEQASREGGHGRNDAHDTPRRGLLYRDDDVQRDESRTPRGSDEQPRPRRKDDHRERDGPRASRSPRSPHQDSRHERREKHRLSPFRDADARDVRRSSSRRDSDAQDGRRDSPRRGPDAPGEGERTRGSRAPVGTAERHSRDVDQRLMQRAPNPRGPSARREKERHERSPTPPVRRANRPSVQLRPAATRPKHPPKQGKEAIPRDDAPNSLEPSRDRDKSTVDLERRHQGHVIIWRPGLGGGFGFAASDPDVPGFRYSCPDKGIYVHCSELPERCTLANAERRLRIGERISFLSSSILARDNPIGRHTTWSCWRLRAGARTSHRIDPM